MNFASFNYNTYLACFLLGVLISLLLTPLVIRLAVYLDVVAKPDYRKVHSKLMPLMGGLAVFVGMWLPIFLLLCWNNKITIALAEHWHTIACIFLGVSVMLILGIIDDKYGISPIKKLLVETVAAVSLVVAGIEFSYITVPFYGKLFLGSFGPPLTILWIVGITNAINLIDGLDGLAIGVTFFIASVTAVIAIINANYLMALMMCSLAGASLGFLRYNFSPAKIFLGDTGSLFVGMVLATTSIVSNFKGTLAASMIVPVILLGYPIIDTFLAIIRRKIVGKPVFTPDKDHIHHRLLQVGVSQRKATLILYVFCLMFCTMALLTVLQNKTVVGVAFLCLVIISVIGAKNLGYFDVLKQKHVLQERPIFRLAYLTVEIAKTKIKMAQSEHDIWNLVRDACDGFEMGSIDIRCNGKEGLIEDTIHLSMQRKKASIFAFKENGRKPKMNSIELELKELDAKVLVDYRQQDVSSELETEIPRLVMELIKVAKRRILQLRINNQKLAEQKL